MATTVQLSQETKQQLERYKESVGATTYEDAIVRLLRGTESESAFGSIPDWEPWTETDRLETRSDTGDI